MTLNDFPCNYCVCINPYLRDLLKVRSLPSKQTRTELAVTMTTAPHNRRTTGHRKL